MAQLIRPFAGYRVGVEAHALNFVTDPNVILCASGVLQQKCSPSLRRVNLYPFSTRMYKLFET